MKQKERKSFEVNYIDDIDMFLKECETIWQTFFLFLIDQLLIKKNKKIIEKEKKNIF